jgi:hypothetical protein
LGFGKAKMVKLTWETGTVAMSTAKVYILGKTGINMKVNGLIHLKKAKEWIYLPTVTHFKGAIKRENQTVRGPTNGKMEHHTQEVSKMVLRVVTASGKKISNLTQIPMKVTLNKT